MSYDPNPFSTVTYVPRSQVSPGQINQVCAHLSTMERIVNGNEYNDWQINMKLRNETKRIKRYLEHFK